MPKESLAHLFDEEMRGYTREQMEKYYDHIVRFSDSTYKNNLKRLGCIDLDSPATVNLYARSFDSKEGIKKAIEKYNETADENPRIRYTDYVGIVMSSITSIIDAVTYILVAFIAISLIVSSVMIAVTTLISVQERTGEIGILRAIGAFGRNISCLFNAETMIVGLAAGLMGGLLTNLLCVPLNAIIRHLIGSVSIYLPGEVAVCLVAVSVVLTMISGLIPARSAAKKNPVEALRIE